MKKKPNKHGFLLIGIGMLLLAAALVLTGYNLWDDHRAAASVESAMKEMHRLVDKAEPTPQPDGMIPDYVLAPEIEMPTVEVDECDYIGYISIPSLGIELPVMSEWSYSNLKTAPCRYAGSAYLDDLVICAHNYSHHFGSLGRLKIGDPVYFTDIDGNLFSYAVAEQEQVEGTDAEKMQSGDWALSLFTCTVSGQYRVTIRCDRTNV